MGTELDIEAIGQDYERDGVVRVRGLLAPEEVRRVRAELKRYGEAVVPTLPPEDVTFEADGQTVRNLWRMERHAPFFAELTRRPRIVDLVARLVKGTPVSEGVETFNKPAKIGSGVPPHQDNAYFCRTPPDMLTVWIALDPATLENGPIYYIRGSHKAMRPHRPSGVKGNSMGLAEPFDKSDPFVGTLEPGDALIHHSQTIHYSAPNRSEQSRCGMLMVYRGAHTEYDPEMQEAYAVGRASV